MLPRLRNALSAGPQLVTKSRKLMTLGSERNLLAMEVALALEGLRHYICEKMNEVNGNGAKIKKFQEKRPHKSAV